LYLCYQLDYTLYYILILNAGNLDERKAIRDRRIRDEQRLAKRIEERSCKKQSLPPEWHNRDLFPECGYDPFSDKRYLIFSILY